MYNFGVLKIRYGVVPNNSTIYNHHFLIITKLLEQSVGHRYWGGGDEDPVSATDDFIWNKDFVPRMKRLIDNEPAEPISIKITVTTYPLHVIY